jgi:ribosomal protein S18 acetylase RimI-like enzyme
MAVDYGPMRLRRARPEDAEAVAAIFGRARAEMTYLPVLHTPEEDRAFFGRVVGEHEVWAAERDGRVAGFAALSEAMLEHLYVDPDLQGGGLGSVLMDRAKERRPAGFELWVFQRNEAAIRFYERHGCRLVRRTDGAGNEEREPDALYAWHPRDRGQTL